MAPAGTPKEIVTLLSSTTIKALQKKEAAEKFANLGTDVAPMEPAQLAGFIRSEIAKWSKMAREAGIQPQ